MSNVVVSGACCKCTMGTSPSSIAMTSQMKIKAGEKPIAVITDNSMACLGTFGMCTSMINPAVASATAAAMGVLTPQPCVPSVNAPWIPTKTKILIGGKPVLTNDSATVCTLGMGNISITNPGQGKVKIL